MGVYLALVNHDDLFNRSTVSPIIINDLASATEEDKAYVNNLIRVKFDSDLLSNEPSCECGETKGGFALGIQCPNCRTPVREIFDQPLQSLVWMRSPKGIEKLMNPMVLTQLSQKFTKAGFNLIEWMCNTDYHPAVVKPEEVNELLSLGVVRGYNSFIVNFDHYIELLFSLKHFRAKKGKEEYLQEHLQKSRECLMSWHLALPNKSLLVIENTNVGIYVDPIVVGAVDAIYTICSIDTPLINLTLRQKENRVAKTLFILMKFYTDVYHDIMASKNGLYRKHAFGTRNHFSARAVISSNTMAHEYDELHISWGVGITMLKLHLMNKLIKRNWAPNEATALLQQATYAYHPLVDELFHELIDESPQKCLPCIFQRNPSLARSSAQRMRITKVKIDPNDPTLTLSILAVKGFNADSKMF
jgi:hypothetical protein